MYHKVTVLGNVGTDAKLYDGINSQYIRFSLASNRLIRNSNGVQEEVTIWFNITKTGHDLTGLLAQITKGSRVLVEGVLVADKLSGHPKIFTNKAGVADAAYEIAANNIVLISHPLPKEKPFISNLMKTDYDIDYDEEELYGMD